MFSLFLLLRGHYLPGGGFSGGLVAAAAVVIYGLAFGWQEAKRSLKVDPIVLIGIGLVIALVSGLPGLFFGEAFMTGVWTYVGTYHLGTPFIFDIGVYLVVIGVVLAMVFNMAEIGEFEMKEEL